MKQIHIITGCYGVGKTEFALNYVLKLQKTVNEKVYVADLDFINPYFRTQERISFLKDNDIEVLTNSFNNNPNLDIPTISKDIIRRILNKDYLVIDLAGNLNGLKVLQLYKEYLTSNYEFYVVLNCYREDNDSVMKMVDYIRDVESFSNLKVTALIANNHLLEHTTKEVILLGDELVKKVSNLVNKQLKYTVVLNKFSDLVLNSKLMIIDNLLIRKSWM